MRLPYPPTLPPASVRRLWEGCVLVTVGEAFGSAISGSGYWIGQWEGPDYRVDGESGDYGTLCFRGDRVVGLFFHHGHRRSPWVEDGEMRPLDWFLPDLPANLTAAVHESAIPYLRRALIDPPGLPVTAGFWGEGSMFVTPEPWGDVFWNGAFVLEIEFRTLADALVRIASNHHLPPEVAQLVATVAGRRWRDPTGRVELSASELTMLLDTGRALESSGETRVSESKRLAMCRELLAQVGIGLP